MAISSQRLHNEFAQKVEEVSGESLSACYQCGTCSAGCFIVDTMDISPRKAIHLARLGMEEKLANCNTGWQCASCLACSVRCPRGIDVAKIMAAIRLLSLRKNVDYVQPSKIVTESSYEFPQIALVSSFRKHTA